jgi:TP901 family phage tail tape measure protein
MADENIVTNIVANADFSGLIADVNKVAASLSKLQAQIIQSDARLASQVATMNRSFGENLRRTGQFATHFVTLTSDVEKFGTNLDKGQMKLKNYFQTFQQHTKTQGGLIRELAKQQVALQNAIIQPMGKNAQGLMQYSVHIPQGLDAIKNKTALAKQELQIMNKVIQDGGVQMINWGKNTQWAGRQLTVGLTVPLAAFGTAAAKAFREADAELTRLTKVYGGLAATSSTELGKVRNEVSATAKEIAKAYGVSFKDTITLAADIAATGKQGNDLLNSVKETSRLAVLGEVDRQDAMKATLAIQTTFKQNTEQLSESINFLNAVENQTSTSLADLIEAIPKAGPVIQGMGGSVKDLALYLTAMKEGGINAAEGANALKSALASLINPTKVAKEKFSEMGIDLGGIVTKNAGNLTGTILELQKALDNLDPLQKQQAIEQLFGKFQFARLNALFSNLGKQGSQTLQVMDLMKASSSELAGVAGRELSMVTESASGKYRRALEGLKADLAVMGEEFLKVQTFFINVTDGILKFINKLPAPIKTILTFVTGLTAIIGPVIMLTGVLANFFGYIIKGASHFRSLFKGGEGWKMLTPEILAAQKAGSLVEATFYSDAKAATVLKTAIAGLVTEFEILQSKAMTGAVSVGPALSTVAGNVVVPGGGRVVNPNHPLISPEDTRSMSHLNPVAGMSTDARAAQTIFGVVPGAPKVNQKIGNNPQMYMSGDLPKIPGLTSIGGASTGIVAEEAAKWHAMTGALAMQSQSEIALLKKEVAATGLITASLSDSYQALLPTMTKLTANAAIESAAIVAQLQAGKLTVDQARAKIIALNAQVESMIAQASVDIAGQQGRSIGLTTVPLLNQPVVNKDGKTNMKELTRPGRTRDLLNKIARGLGVKTFGAGYSTETTIPKRLNSGGKVFTANDGDIVPGTGNTDTVPAMLTPGEFVINKEATAANLPILEAINDGSLGGPVSSEQGGYGLRPSPADVTRMFGGLFSKARSRSTVLVRGNPLSRHYWSTATGRDTNARRSDLIESHNSGWAIKNPQGKPYTQKELESLSKDEVNSIWSGVDRSHFAPASARNADGQYISPALFGPQPRHGAGGNLSLNVGGNPKAILDSLMSTPLHPFSTMRSAARQLGYPSKDINKVFEKSWTELQSKLRSRTKPFGKDSDTFEEFAGKILNKNLKDLKIPESNVNFYDEMQKLGTIRGSGIKGSGASVVANDPDIIFRNKGGIIPGYNAGGPVGNILKTTAFKNIGAKFGKIGDKWGATSLSIGMGKKLFGSSGLTPKAQNLMYGKLVENLEKERPYGYVKDAQGSLQKALEPDIVDAVIKSAAGDVLSSGGKSLSKIDREILRTKYANWDNKSWTPSTSKIRKQMFGMNKGGMVPGTQYFNTGGKVKGVQYLNKGTTKPITFSSAYQQERSKGVIGKGMMGSGPMAGMGIGMGMQMAGGAIGGQAGQIMQFASVLPMLAPNMLGSLGKLAGGFKGIGGAAGLAGKAIGLAMRFALGPIGILITALTVGYALFKKFQKEREQDRIEKTNSVGITEKSAAEAGIKYNNLSNSIKAVNDQLDLARAKGKNAFEALNSSGIQGLTLSIKELREGIKNAKENQKELVATFTDIDVSGDANKQAKVTEIATNLKAQFIAAGNTAEEATNKIYAIISASDKADMAFSAISSKGFREIIDAASAADAMVLKLAKSMDTSGGLGLYGKDLGNAISNVAASLDVNLNNLMKTKDANGELITQQEAMSKILDDINSKQGSQTTITQGQIESLKETHPELAKILNTSDNVAGMYSKWRLLLAGVRTDLSQITSEQAQAMLKFEAALDSSIVASEEKSSGSGIAARSQKSIDALQKRIDAGGEKAAKNAQKTQDQIKEEIKLIDKKINKINEEADARKKALEASQSKENLLLEIQKAQFEYADKMAAGDMSGAAQAQLKIKQLLGEKELQKGIDSIEENRAKREKELVVQREKLQAQSDKAAKNLTNAQNNAATATQRMSKVDQYQNEYQSLTKQQARIDLVLEKDPSNKQALKDQQELVRGPLGDLAKRIAADSKGSDKVLAEELKKIFTGTLIDKDGKSLAGGMSRSYNGSMLGPEVYQAGKADNALKQDASAALAGARAITGTGNKTLTDLYNAYTGTGVQGSTTKATAVEIPLDSKYGGNTNKGGLETWAKEQIIMSNKLKDGQYFKYNGQTYKVGPKMSAIRQKWGGGQFASGDMLQVNDRINSMGAQMEGIGTFIKPNFSGKIYPNAATMPKYDVGSYSTSNTMKQSGANSSISNVTINATLNFGESPKNGKELWKEFKQMAKAEGAKVGENILIGGSY